jgi:MFS family permease
MNRQARLHYAWIVAGVTFLVLLVTAGIRATPGVLMVPLEAEFGWTSAAISTAIAINLALFGLIGPFAASLMDRWGLRRLVLCALLLLAASVGLTTVMKSQWQLVLLWGVCVGSGTGVTSLVLAAVVANRWFDKHRGLVLGGLTAANATGQLLFLPLLVWLLEHFGWRSVSLAVAGSAAAVFIFVLRSCGIVHPKWPLSHMGGSMWADRSRYMEGHRYAPSKVYATPCGRQLSGYWQAASLFVVRVRMA